MSHTNVSNLNDSSQAKIQALEERLNEATRQLQSTQKEFQARLQEQDTQNKLLMEAITALKSEDKAESPDLKGKGKEPMGHQEER